MKLFSVIVVYRKLGLVRGAFRKPNLLSLNTGQPVSLDFESITSRRRQSSRIQATTVRLT